MEEKEKIADYVVAALPDTSCFLVDIQIAAGGKKKVTVVVDADEGLKIDDCAKISRQVGLMIEEEGLFDQAWMLDVTSPGLDSPLTLWRQYKKNVGRAVKVKKKDGNTLKGKLLKVDQEQITLGQEKGPEKEIQIIFEEIDWTKIQVSFK
ncbi:MAG: ribosome maturation factor RimP [Cyclobacteriaceae bacterium]|nr:ribosome maturation factor RimP [Cyclobacteriaceae bacterium]